MTITPMFGCFAGSGSGEIRLLLGIVAIAWMGSLLLALANLFYIFRMGFGGRQTAHLAFFAAYAFAVLALFVEKVPSLIADHAQFAIIGAPVCAIIHFVILLHSRASAQRAPTY